MYRISKGYELKFPNFLEYSHFENEQKREMFKLTCHNFNDMNNVTIPRQKKKKKDLITDNFELFKNTKRILFVSVKLCF